MIQPLFFKMDREKSAKLFLPNSIKLGVKTSAKCVSMDVLITEIKIFYG